MGLGFEKTGSRSLLPDQDRRRKAPEQSVWLQWAFPASLAVVALIIGLSVWSNPNDPVLQLSPYTYRVFGPANDVVTETSHGDISFHFYTPSQQRDLLIQYGPKCQQELQIPVDQESDNILLKRFDELPPHFAVELWKYCMLYTGVGNLYWEPNNAKPWISWDEWLPSVTTLGGDRTRTSSLALRVEDSATDTVIPKEMNGHLQILHSLLYLAHPQSRLAADMMRILLHTNVANLDPVQMAETLGLYIEHEPEKWTLITARCVFLETTTPLNVMVEDKIPSKGAIPKSRRLVKATNTMTADALPQRHCPASHGGYCCQVWQPGTDWPIMAIHRPYIAVKDIDIPLPYMVAINGQTLDDVGERDLALSNSDVPYIATVTSVSTSLPPVSNHETPNFFDILMENSCLPGTRECFRCLKLGFHGEPGGGSCEACQSVCQCFCKVLCKVRPPPKRISAEWTVRRPVQRKDPSRHIPREIHQTWFEPITQESYPNMSRLIESFRQAGWTYHFYDDELSAQFLSAHFPPEVREAYDSITPGAFKADLFRYCVLLIRGGLYVDMDILLESNLDNVIPPEIGFMTPQDEPGSSIDARSCLWNGFLASAPGHPFLARTIQNVVNNIRNRFTSVDYDDMLCPDPVLSVAHSVDVLFTCGPCILGSSINEVLGKHPQANFEYGDIDLYGVEREKAGQYKDENPMSSNHRKLVVDPDDHRLLIPGRSILLRQNKNDMGAHRFTWDQHNTVVATTDLPDYDDRPKSKGHYSDTHEQFGIYGLHKLYVDEKRANEVIKITVQA
jgi:hypothetical protein